MQIIPTENTLTLVLSFKINFRDEMLKFILNKMDIITFVHKTLELSLKQ